jgi:hypothetical protein
MILKFYNQVYDRDKFEQDEEMQDAFEYHLVYILLSIQPLLLFIKILLLPFFSICQAILKKGMRCISFNHKSNIQ